jgi:hypothetical protein
MAQVRCAKYTYESCTSTKMSTVMLYRCVDACSVLCLLRDLLVVVVVDVDLISISHYQCRTPFRPFYPLYCTVLNSTSSSNFYCGLHSYDNIRRRDKDRIHAHAHAPSPPSSAGSAR